MRRESGITRMHQRLAAHKNIKEKNRSTSFYNFSLLIAFLLLDIDESGAVVSRKNLVCAYIFFLDKHQKQQIS
jgi:hypothetical protein